jgi:hypothetical protein
MKPYKKYGWKGVYDVSDIPNIPTSNHMSFIINVSPLSEKIGHWVAVNIIKNDVVEYYDPLAEEPSKQFMKNIKVLIDKLHPDSYMKLKINRVQVQESSANCGWHSMKFLIGRYEGKLFKECSCYSMVRKAEKNIEKFKEKFPKFDYI